VDFVIAATVQELEATLWTRNRKHFPMLPNLRDPYEP
jgi:predicted nucleic acid-binding protein